MDAGPGTRGLRREGNRTAEGGGIASSRYALVEGTGVFDMGQRWLTEFRGENILKASGLGISLTSCFRSR